MSRWLDRNPDGTYKEEIESMELCKWMINEVCCNEQSEYLADYPHSYCKCENEKDCKYFEKEDGVIKGKWEVGGKK